MPSAIRTFLPVAGDADAVAAAFDGDPQRWLPASRPDGDGWLLRVHAGSIGQTVRAIIGSPWHAGATHWRSLGWDPVTDDPGAASLERLLPSLEGEIGLHREPAGTTTLVFDARYHPPGGALGVAVDAMALRRVARTTIQRFVEDVASRLSAEAVLISSAPRNAPKQDGPAPAHT